MSGYSLVVTVRDGVAQVQAEGDVPDGVFIVQGHDVSPQTRSINVQHTDHEGGLHVSAGATHAKYPGSAEE